MLVLASASPRRQDLLRNAGISFEVQATNIPEMPRDGEAPRDFAERLAREKATAVLAKCPGRLVLGADTIVVIDGRILGKPEDEADAARMLRMLSGRTHEVITAVCLAGTHLQPLETQIGFKGFLSRKPEPQGLKSASVAASSGIAKAAPYPKSILESSFEKSKVDATYDVRSEITVVTMSALSEEDIRSYVASGEPMDKAGSYAIQGIASRWITRIEGDYCNVVGLPVALVWQMLKERGAAR